MLLQLRAAPCTYLHSDLRFHFPVGADDLAGEVLIAGIGFSHVLWSDPIAPPIGRSRALILTGETVITSFLDGTVTPGIVGAVPAAIRQDAETTSVMQHIGLREVWTKRFSTGVSLGFPLAHSHTHDFEALFEVQWRH